MSTANMNQSIEYAKTMGVLLDELVNRVKDRPIPQGLINFATSENLSEQVLFYREVRTVQFDSSRQTGKTHWAIRNSDKDTLVLTARAASRDSFKNAWMDVISNRGQYLPTIWSHRDLERALDNKEYKTFKKIIVDEASYYFDSQLRNRFYKSVLPLCTPETIFVLLG